MYSYGAPHMAKQKQDDPVEHTYISYVMIRDVTLTTCQRRWMIGRSDERCSGISVLAARHDDDDLSLVFIFIRQLSKEVRNIFDIWTLTKRLEKKLDGNYTRMLRAILNKSWQQRPTRKQLYGHLSRKLSKLDEPDMPDTAGEARTRS